MLRFSDSKASGGPRGLYGVAIIVGNIIRTILTLSVGLGGKILKSNVNTYNTEIQLNISHGVEYNMLFLWLDFPENNIVVPFMVLFMAEYSQKKILLVDINPLTISV